MPKFDKNSCKLNWYLDLFIFFNCSGITMMCVFVALFCFSDPRQVIFLGELVPARFYAYFPWGILVSTFHGYLIIVICLNLVITSSMIFISVFYTTLLFTQELRFGRAHYKSEDILRQPSHLILAYRALQISHTWLMEPLGHFLVFFHTALTIVPVYIFFVIAHHGKRLQVVVSVTLLLSAIVSIMFWLAVIQLGKHLCVGGGKTFGSWKRSSFQFRRSKDTKVLNAFRRSCKPLLISYGRIFKIQRITQLTYSKGIVRGTFRSLLTLAKH